MKHPDGVVDEQPGFTHHSSEGWKPTVQHGGSRAGAQCGTGGSGPGEGVALLSKG